MGAVRAKSGDLGGAALKSTHICLAAPTNLACATADSSDRTEAVAAAAAARARSHPHPHLPQPPSPSSSSPPPWSSSSPPPPPPMPHTALVTEEGARQGRASCRRSVQELCELVTPPGPWFRRVRWALCCCCCFTPAPGEEASGSGQ